MRINTLEADTRLAKTYDLANDKLNVTPYPMVSRFTSQTHEVETIEDLYELVKECADNPYRCLVKGELQRELNRESRAGSTNSNVPTQWVCLDFDYIDIPDRETLDSILSELGFNDVSYVIQYGSSHGIDKDFSVHVFLLLDKPVLPRQLKNWLMNKNLTVEKLCNAITLQRTDVALSWPLDITVAQNDKLIYTAPPVCRGFKVPQRERVELVSKGKPVATVADEICKLTPGPVEAKAQKQINELRKAKGLNPKKLTIKSVGSLEVATNPDAVTVTGSKNERGFTYININGGDSWGYYFQQDKPDIVYNFKGEPNYRLRDLDKDFYYQYKRMLKDASTAEDSKAQPFAFLDRKSDRYYRGVYMPETQQVEIYGTNSLKKLQDFAAQNDYYLGDHVEEWDYEFRFDSDVVFSREDQFINRYRRTRYMRASLDNEDIPHQLPPTIAKVLYSVVGDDADVLIHFLNWLAFIVQERKMAQTAWVFNGREGTGKGVLFNYIISPLIGPDYCKTIRLAALEEDMSNAYLEDTVFLMIDESKTTQIRNYEKVMAMLKNLIVEPRIAIRKMYTDAYMAPNYVNVIVTSNHPDAMYISNTDRRFNVGVYQQHRLHLTDEDIQRIGDELWDFAKILRTMPVNAQQARRVLENAARERMMYLTETSISVATTALREGNLEFFIDCLPSETEAAASVPEQVKLERYVEVLREAQEAAKRGETMRVTRDQVQLLMEYSIGEVPKTANKFSSFMKHYGIMFRRMRKGEKTPSCFEVDWNESAYSIEDCLGRPTGATKVRAVK